MVDEGCLWAWIKRELKSVDIFGPYQQNHDDRSKKAIFSVSNGIVCKSTVVCDALIQFGDFKAHLKPTGGSSETLFAKE